VYATSYAASATWPPTGLSTPSLALPTVGVVVLLASGLTMTRGLRRVYHADYPRGVVSWLAATLAGAVIFASLVGVSLSEVGFGIGEGIYESLFYVLVGLELAHAIGGVVLFGLVLVRAGTGELELRRDPVQSAAIYWYFVVALGVAIYAILYLAVQ
jgi:heme/copper-type cytochrome/quinol oxidase subunit 3